MNDEARKALIRAELAQIILHAMLSSTNQPNSGELALDIARAIESSQIPGEYQPVVIGSAASTSINLIKEGTTNG